MMTNGTQVSLDEYLRSVYDPDCEYVDGELVERNRDEFDHSALQGIIYALLFNQSRESGTWVFLNFACRWPRRGIGFPILPLRRERAAVKPFASPHSRDSTSTSKIE
jgi:hypothetical protein